ncbi:PREDICTED: protein SCAR2 [Fragaria vesca subsp. vesca]|uniref:protein SCAR2 n=1 Tax=Fragaria vesca subsp. vesca TaxID=101020 RepID=UPI0002C2E749|nr:PREDICTED: protein SCAR2 [Fragaria vesca subsp. vesca]
MPLTRYQIRNEYGLADPELYKAADRDDPEALLEGVAMAGLVGVLRQLGDLAEFAAEIFHDLHEEVMATATRGHGLMVRVQQLEADFPTIEKALLLQTNHSSFFSNSGVDWHPNLLSEQNLITCGDLPRFVMDSYEECRGPPRLFLLDKFDVAGAGACLKRYTDPSFFKVESAYSLASADIQRERKARKVKHKKGSRWRNGETPEVLLPSHAKLHELFLEERIENGYSDPARRVKLKRRHLNGSAVDSRTRKSYMDKFVETHSPECRQICATSVTSPPLNLSSDNNNESGLRILDISIVSPAEKSPERGNASSLTNEQEVVSKQLMDTSYGGSFDGEIAKGSEPNSDGESDNSYSNLQMVAVDKELEVDGEDKTEGSVEGYSSDDLPSEVDNYVDALATMESELDTDNESRAKSNLPSMKVNKCRTVSDANEEVHVELQAQSLDSQSNENSSTSDDWNNSFERDRASLNSDTLSNLAENTPSECDAAAKEPATETCGSEGTCIEEGVIPGREMSPTQQHPDLGATSPVASYVGSLLDETSSDKIKVGSESFGIKENGTNLDHLMAVVPDDSSQAKDEFTSTSPTLPLVEADEKKLCATSDDLPHLKNVEELVSVNHSGNDSVNEVFQAKCADEDAVGSFASRKIDSPHLSIPSTEAQLFPAAMKEVQTSSGTTIRPHSSDVAKPVYRVSQVDDPFKPTAFKSGVIPWRRISRESYPEGDAPQTHVPKEQKDDPQTHVLKEQKDDPQTHVLMAQKISDLDEDMSHSKEKFNIEESCRTLDDEEIGLFTCNVDLEGGDSASKEIPSNPPTYSGHGDHVLSANIEHATVHVEDVAASSAAVVKFDDINDFIDTSPGATNVDAEEGDSVSLELPSNSPTYSGLGNLVISDNIVPETVHGEDLSSAAVAKSDDVNDIDTSPDTPCFPPLNSMNLHESLLDSRDPHLKESEMDEVASPKSVSDSEMHKEVTEVVSPDSESDPNKSVAYDPSISEVNDDDHNISLDEQNELGVTVYDAHTASTSLEMNNHESRSQSLDQSCGEYPGSSSTSALPEADLREAETKLETSLELQANQVQMENLEIDRASDQVEAALELSPEFQSDELGMEDSQDDQVSTNSLNSQQIVFPSQPDKEISNLPSTDHIIQETCLDASSESLPENSPSQPSTSKFFTESAGQETDILKQKVEPLESILPNLVQPPVVDLEGTPPLPPLPPMQWRLGMMQHTSLASHRDLGGVSSGTFLPMQSLKADEKAQFDLVPQRELLQPQNPFLSLTSEEDIESQPIFEPVVGHEVSPAPYPQVPTDNDSNHQYNFPDLGGMQFSSSFISKVSGDNTGHNDIVSEGEKGLSSLEPFTVPGSESSTSTQDPVLLHREIVYPHQLMPEGLELEVLQQSFNNSEMEQARPLAAFVTAPTVEDEQPQHSLPTTEGGQVHSTSKPLIIPGTECTTSELDSSFPHGETIQPPQQVTQDSGLEPEDLCRSLRISEREQEKPLATSVTATTTVDEKPQYGLSTSGGETAWSSNTSDVMPDSEVAKSNGTVNKIPRPRNPLIDAVTAHGQSKLKKASERIQPQIEPKVDERDSFLQQIRTKSFNLKPATVTRSAPRPNIQGHNPNLKVISLLEKKAIAIRQAFAGSDEDDDDSWSDS